MATRHQLFRSSIV